MVANDTSNYNNHLVEGDDFIPEVDNMAKHIIINVLCMSMNRFKHLKRLQKMKMLSA